MFKAHGGTRTHNFQIRSLTRYPIASRGHKERKKEKKKKRKICIEWGSNPRGFRHMILSHTP